MNKIYQMAKSVHQILDTDMYKESYYQNVFRQYIEAMPNIQVHTEVDILYFKPRHALPLGRGRDDIVIIDSENVHHIIELKVEARSIYAAICQAKRYYENYTYGKIGSVCVVNFRKRFVEVKFIKEGEIKGCMWVGESENSVASPSKKTCQQIYSNPNNTSDHVEL